MKYSEHPHSEEWLPYLDDEASPEVARRLSDHLETCPACADEVAARQRSIDKLRQFNWPEHRHTARVPVQIVKWGIAATLVLGIGFGLGKLFSQPAASEQQLRAELESSLRVSFRAELQTALDHAQADGSNALAAAEGRVIGASEAALRRFWQGMAETVEAARQEDRRATLALLQRMQQQQEAQYVSLRKELETLASRADEEIRLARLRITELAGIAQTNDGN